MAEQEQPQETQASNTKKSFAGRVVIVLVIMLIFICMGVSGLWTLHLSTQVSSLSSELKTLRANNKRLTLVEDKLATVEIQSRLQTLERSIAAVSKLADTFKQVDAAKADELKSVVKELQSKRDLLQKQLDNYEQAIKKPLEGSPDVPRLQAVNETSPSAAVEAGKDQQEAPTWWSKIVNFRLFSGNK